MNSNIEVHNIKISLKIKTPHISYISKVITKNQKKNYIKILVTL